MILINYGNEAALSFNDFSFIYGTDKTKRPAVSNITFKLKDGETLIIAGPSGSGKSTLSYAMNGIIPWRLKGFMKGAVKIFGRDIWDYEFSGLSKLVGLVTQNPLDQLTTFTVRDEIAFGLENLRYSEEEIVKKVDEIAEFMQIQHLLDRDINQLSGGQKQITVLSSFLAMEPKLLILDEPIAYLDQKSESLLLNQLKKLKYSDRYSLTLVIIEHRLARVMDIADKILVLNDKGNAQVNGKIGDVFRNDYRSLKECNLRVPWFSNIFEQLKKQKQRYTNIKSPIQFAQIFDLVEALDKEALALLKQIILDSEVNPKFKALYKLNEMKILFSDLYIESLKGKLPEDSVMANNNTEKSVILETQGLSFEYPNSGIKAIDNLSIKIEKGDFIGVIGANGSGKTTLLYLLANLYNPTEGKILFNGMNVNSIDPIDYAQRVGFIFQNPENMIFKPTIKDELLYAPINFKIVDNVSDQYLNKLIGLIGIKDQNRNPFQLSWGQKRRLNLGSVFIYNPEIILLDEPFIGQDQRTIDFLIETLFLENKRGKTIIISSHDYHLLLKYTKHILELNKNGRLIDYDTKENYFNKHQNLGPILLLDKIKKLIQRM